MDLSKVLEFACKNKLIDKKLSDFIVKSQFRSFDFVPRVTRWLKDGFKVPSVAYLLSSESLLHPCVWCIDAFGNAKTTILSNEAKLLPKQKIKTNLGTFKYYNRLKDIPLGETAIYTGSSGIGNKRFLELATQGKKGSAAKILNLKVGKNIKFL